MRLIKPITVALCGVLMLNGCTTMMTWAGGPEGNEGVFSKKESDHVVANDDIQAFGVVREHNEQLAQGSLVMMGKKYWFVVNPQDSAKLQSILNVKLDKQFQIVKRTGDSLGQFPVEVKSADSNDFSSSFCLGYHTKKPSEIEKLTALSFKAKNVNDKNMYIRCETASGKFYSTPRSFKADYRFENSFPVSVMYTKTETKVNGFKLIDGIFMTPFTLAFDAVAAVILLPTLLINGMK